MACTNQSSGLHIHRSRGPYKGSQDPPNPINCTKCEKRTLYWIKPPCTSKVQYLCWDCVPNMRCFTCGDRLSITAYYHCLYCDDGNMALCTQCFNLGLRCHHLQGKARYRPNPFGVYPGSGPPPNPQSYLPVAHTISTPSIPALIQSHHATIHSAAAFTKPPNEEKITNVEDLNLDQRLEASVVTEKPNVRWEDVAGLQAAKDVLQEAIIFPMRFPELFNGKRKPRNGILLYGPPGTGKSYLAKAVATEIDCKILSISTSDIFSKWLGESERLVKLLFTKARVHKPAIIFIDEIEALCGQRGSNDNEAADRVKTEFLVQMDGVGNDTSGITVIGATNLPWQLNSAMRRRFQCRIHIGLPDFAARERAFHIHVGDMVPGLQSHDYKNLAKLTEGYSASDIANIVQDTLMIPIHKIHVATHYRRVSATNKLMPCAASEPSALTMTWREIPQSSIQEPPLEVADFFSVLKKFKSAVSQEDVRRAKQWTDDFGTDGR